MKKTHETRPRQKLVLRREALTQLTPPQLRHAAAGFFLDEDGGGSYWPPCPTRPPGD